MADEPVKKGAYEDPGEPWNRVMTCAHGVTDTGKFNLGNIMNYAAMAAAGINTAAAIRMADLQYDIAKRYLDIAKWWRDWYNNNYIPWEDVELDESWGLTPVEPMYDTTVGRHKTFGRLQFRGIIDKSLQCTSPYCTGLRQALLKDVIDAEATAISALANMGYRNEQSYVLARNDVRWLRQAETLKRGRGMVANNVQYASLAAGIFGDLGRQAGIAAGGALRYLGYSWNKNETTFPTLTRGRVERQMDARIDIPAVVPASYPIPSSPDPYMSGVPNAVQTPAPGIRPRLDSTMNPNWSRG